MPETWVVWAIVALALAFDFGNGMHDAANSIATVVSTRVMKPGWAVLWAAFFNFVAFLIFDTKVANTIAKDIVAPTSVSLAVITAGLVGATAWNIITWYYGIPSSSSHALVGGFAGAAVAHTGFNALIIKSVTEKGLTQIAAFIIVAPIIGMLMGFILMVATYWAFHRVQLSRISGIFRKLQFVSAAAYSLGHGGNDAQKTMGIIMAVLVASKTLGANAKLPVWVVIACHTAMGLGTLCGGWRIVRTMGQRICALEPVHGFAAETGGALCLYGATWLGIPVSTTHTITGAIVGVGSTRGPRAVRWGVAGRVVWAWVLTIPAAASVAALSYGAFSLLGWH